MIRLHAYPFGMVTVALWMASPATAWATESGEIAAAMVSEASYRHFMNDVLYTHDGDDRSFGPEHDLARDNIEAILTGYGLDVTLEPFPYLSETYYNVVATKWGTVHPDQAYIIASHFDSINDFGGGGAPGAGDNATGVALMLEAARVLSNFDSDYTIRFIAFDRHEQGTIGSSAYVAAHAGDTVLGVIAPDMIASGGSQEVIIHGGPASVTFRDAVGDAIATYGQDLIPVLESDFAACLNDHCPFQAAGVPGCRLLEYRYMSNPYDHTADDSVDRMDYIDYSYGTKVTRAIAGFLVDRAIVHVAANGDYTGDGSVDGADYDELVRCLTVPDSSPLDPNCLFFDYLGDGDIDCDDANVFEVLWTGAGDPPLPWQCRIEPAAVAADGSRCLQVTPPPHEQPLALLVTGDASDDAMSCLSLYVQPDGQLDTSPVFRMWNEWGTMHVCDAQVIPESRYDVWSQYGLPEAFVQSNAASLLTGLWADTAGIVADGQWGPPNDDQSIMDVVAILDAFRSLPGAPPVRHVDLVGMGDQGTDCSPDQSIDVVDVLAALEAFRGIPFRETANCPLLCP